MVGVTYRSSSCRPVGQGGARMPPSGSMGDKAGVKEVTQAQPSLSFRDKDSYQELFKPLPKPEPMPTLGSSFKIEAKSWRQLQEEREALMFKEIEKTKDEAMSLWGRAKDEDTKRVDMINSEKQRMEEEQKLREEIMRKGNDERVEKDRARKLEIRRQEELLAGRSMRARTEGLSDGGWRGGGGIQVFHYKDPEVAEIVQATNKEEIRRRMSHGDILRGDRQEQPISHTENSAAAFFNAEVMLRSQSSSSNTSR